METWKNLPQLGHRAITNMYDGDDLFYKQEQTNNWANIEGGLYHINMAGWGDTAGMQRKALFNNLAHNRALVVILIDHQRMEDQVAALEYEVESEWVGGNTNMTEKVRWAHSPARNNRIGGISIGIHPVLGRYATTKPRVDKWGRWVEVDIVGKNNTITTIIGTYGPTGGSNSGEQSMWKYQERMIRAERKQKGEQGKDPNPKEQYINDIDQMLKQKQQESADMNADQHVILAGDMNVNWTSDKTIAKNWRNNMRDNNMINAMAWKWPKMKTWTFSEKKRTWIDHTLVSKTLIQNGTITKAGVETGHSFYTSDHNLCAVNLNINKMIGKIQRVTCMTDIRRRMLRSTDKLSAKCYVEEIECMERKEKNKTPLRVQVKRLYDEVMEKKKNEKKKTNENLIIEQTNS